MSNAIKLTSEESQSSTSLNVDKFIASIMQDLRDNKLDLPTLPQLAVKINKVVGSNSANASEMAKMISADPALSVRLLKVANSPVYRGNRKIENLQMAITLMGTDSIRKIVTSFLLKGLFRSKDKALHQQMVQIWNHSAHVAAISFTLAKRSGVIDPEEAMLAGLLHDVGKLPIISKMRKVNLNDQNIQVLELVLQKLHQPLGKTILQTWHFAEQYVNVAAEHNNWSRNSEKLDLTDIVIVADLLSQIQDHEKSRVPLTEVPAMNKLDLDPQSSIEVMKSAHHEIQAIYKLFS